MLCMIGIFLMKQIKNTTQYQKYYKIKLNKNGYCFPIFFKNDIYFLTNFHLTKSTFIKKTHNIITNKDIIKLKYISHDENMDIILFKPWNVHYSYAMYRIYHSNILSKCIDVNTKYYIYFNDKKYNVYLRTQKKIKLYKNKKDVECILFFCGLKMVNGMSGLPIYSCCGIVGMFMGLRKKNNIMIPIEFIKF